MAHANYAAIVRLNQRDLLRLTEHGVNKCQTCAWSTFTPSSRARRYLCSADVDDAVFVFDLRNFGIMHSDSKTPIGMIKSLQVRFSVLSPRLLSPRGVARREERTLNTQRSRIHFADGLSGANGNVYHLLAAADFQPPVEGLALRDRRPRPREGARAMHAACFCAFLRPLVRPR